MASDNSMVFYNLILYNVQENIKRIGKISKLPNNSSLFVDMDLSVTMQLRNQINIKLTWFIRKNLVSNNVIVYSHELTNVILQPSSRMANTACMMFPLWSMIFWYPYGISLYTIRRHEHAEQTLKLYLFPWLYC